MGVTNIYSNLPGHLVEFKDGGLQYTIEEDISSTKSLLILGTAYDGPVNEPVKIDKATVSQVFGSDVTDSNYFNRATLVKAAKQAFKNGFGDVRCMRVTGSQASTEITKTAETLSEDKEATGTGTIPGNSKQTGIEVPEKKVPIISGSLRVTTNEGDVITTSSYDPYQGIFNINADLTDAGATLDVAYNYFNISEKTTLSAQAVSTDSSTVNATIALLTGDQAIYITEKNASGSYVNGGVGPETDGPIVTITSSGTTLVQGTDYEIDAKGVLSFKSDSTVLTATDTVDIEYYTYVSTSVSGTVTLKDEDYVLTLDKTPNAGTVVITDTASGAVIEDSKYSVSDDTITFKAGEFKRNQAIKITYTYTETTEITESITVQSIYGGSVYKDASVTITKITNDSGETGRRFTFTKPESKKYNDSDKAFYFDSFDVPTVGMLAQALKNYTYNNVFEIVTDDEDMSTDDFPLFSGTLSEGGDDGVDVTNNELYEALSGVRNADGYLTKLGAYQILENYNVDYIYPAGVYADSKQTVNPLSSFHHELCLVCAVLTYRTKMTHGFIDVKPNSNTTLVGIQKYVDNLLTMDNLHYMQDEEGNAIVDSDGNTMDIGWYTSLVVGPEPVISHDKAGKYYGSPAIAYAALCGSLSPESAPTNKQLQGVKGMKYKFSNKQMNALVGNRMVVFKLKDEGTTTASSIPYVVDGMTCGGPSCDYRRIATVQVVTDVVDQVREVCDPYIGEPNTTEQRNSMSALISKRLSYLLTEGEILYYSFQINASTEQILLGECSISLTLAVPQELRKITTVVGLRVAA